MNSTAHITHLVPVIRASLDARLERLLQCPLVAGVHGVESADSRVQTEAASGFLGEFDRLQDRLGRSQRQRKTVWQEQLDGSVRVGVDIDYADLWRGRESDVLADVQDTIEQTICFLTDGQRQLLERSPREFLDLNPPPESVELLGFESAWSGGAEHVVQLVIANAPESDEAIRHIAIVPNLIPLLRQLEALAVIERSEGSALAPLRAMVGMEDGSALNTVESVAPSADDLTDRLDEYQRECVVKALSTPHFAVIKGPPGSGKTTVISTIIKRELERGGRVLVVSPTNVAVDNVVDKLAPCSGDPDDLELRTLPLRYASRKNKLLPVALDYWMGPNEAVRPVTLSRRLEACLRSKSALADALYPRVDPDASGTAPLTRAISDLSPVICGTPIGILSQPAVREAEAGSFDLLVVDEVSKLTMPEFLAVAVKARRWILVGDPDQLPPYNDAEENGATLNGLLGPALELLLSVAARLERENPRDRHQLRMVVATEWPEDLAELVHRHVQAVGLKNPPPFGILEDGGHSGVVFCLPEELDEAVEQIQPSRLQDRSRNPGQPGSVEILVQLGLAVKRPEFASGCRLTDPRLRVGARIFETAFSVYHDQPWSQRADQKLLLVQFRKGLVKYLPSAAVLEGTADDPEDWVRRFNLNLARYFAVNAVSVYDWLVGMPAGVFDVTPLTELGAAAQPLAALRERVNDYTGVLRKQYRMHGSLSQVPRSLFYFGEALHDGIQRGGGACRVRLQQVNTPPQAGETNEAEADAICEVLELLDRRGSESVLLITPYRKQERLLRDRLQELEQAGRLTGLQVEVCTLDRCQGREAEYVIISLVRSRSTVFLDSPKRWNVALTRAKEGLLVFGNVNAFVSEAKRARRDAKERWPVKPPRMSLLARCLEAYTNQINGRS